MYAINQTTSSGDTPLHMSAEKGKTDFVKWLMEKTFDTIIKNRDGKLAVKLVKDKENKEICQIIDSSESCISFCYLIYLIYL